MATKNRRTISIVIMVAIVLMAIVGYRIYANLAANKDRAGRVSQGRVVAVEVANVMRRDIRPVMTFSGNLDPQWTADISPKADGRIDHLYVDEGDIVKAGQTIAVLDTNELSAQVVQAEGNLYSAQAGLEQAELDLTRTDALAKQGAVSVQSLDTARIKRDLAVGQVRSAQGNLSLLAAKLENATIVAPRDGIVVKRYIQAGTFAKAGSPIICIADVTSLLAKATVGEAQIADLAIGSSVKIKISALGDREFNGTVTRISPAAALPARTFTAEVTVPNQDGALKAGMFAKVSIPSQGQRSALVVPEGCLVMREDQKTVFVVTAENQVRQVVLKIGFVGGGWAEVIEGINEGDRIVVNGQNKVKDGVSIKVATAAEVKEGGK